MYEFNRYFNFSMLSPCKVGVKIPVNFVTNRTPHLRQLIAAFLPSNDHPTLQTRRPHPEAAYPRLLGLNSSSVACTVRVSAALDL